MKFSDFSFNPSINQAVEAIGFEKPTPVQQECIPIIMQGKDLIACAQTGTGKTAAYVLPLLNMIHKDNDEDGESIEALIIAPTRELAMQIDQQFEGFAYFTDISSIAVYGGGTGVDFDVEKKALKTGAKIIVATPGRLISHLNMGYCNVSQLRFLILDEADQMLNMGFLPDILKIISFLPEDRQTLLFSATMPPEIRKLARTVLKNPAEINLSLSKPAENITQLAYLLPESKKTATLLSLIDNPDYTSILVFATTKMNVKALEKELIKLNTNVKAIHSDLQQDERKDVLRRFRNKEIRILVATDIVSRGIDIDDISLVVNYNVPQDAEDYVHRVGRTARAEKTGIAITFISSLEKRNFQNIEKLIEREVEKINMMPQHGEEEKELKARKTFRPNRKGHKNKAAVKRSH